MAIFEEHRPVSLTKAREAVKKAGFEYLGAEVLARGHLAWSGKPGKSELLLKDSKAEMIVRLTASDTASVHNRLVEAFRQNTLGDTVQVRGTVLESREARTNAKAAGAQFSLAVTAWTPGGSAKLPPLVPGDTRERPKQKTGSGWF